MGKASKVKNFVENKTSRDKSKYKTRDLVNGYQNLITGYEKDGLKDIYRAIYNAGEVGDEEEIRNKIDSWLDEHAMEEDVLSEKELESGGALHGFTHEEAALVAFLYLGSKGERAIDTLQGNLPTAFDDETGEVGRLEHLKVLYDEIIQLAKDYDLHTLDFKHRPSAMARILDYFFEDQEVEQIVKRESKHSGRVIFRSKNEEEYEKVRKEIEKLVKDRINDHIKEYKNIDEEIDKAIKKRRNKTL